MVKNLENKAEILRKVENAEQYAHKVASRVALAACLAFTSYHIYDCIKQFYQKPLEERIEIRKQLDKEFGREISRVYHNNSIVALVRPGY
jgi:hypothetical protein